MMPPTTLWIQTAAEENDDDEGEGEGESSGREGIVKPEKTMGGFGLASGLRGDPPKSERMKKGAEAAFSASSFVAWSGHEEREEGSRAARLSHNELEGSTWRVSGE